MSKLLKRALMIMILLFGIVATTTSILSGWNLYRSLTEEFKSKGTAIARSIADFSVEILELFPHSGYGRQSSSNNDRGGLTDGITAPR
ncbi:hypothetical protein C2W62_41330 [Candidatus Entotheonella serta]|nr:hypothetical protein C2W62_41330 [Candidatus Entotheonella serta]